MSELNYNEFISTKQFKISECGHVVDKSHIHSKLFVWQRDIVAWAIKKGRCAIFLDTGLGKTFIQLEWARLLNECTLIIAPLSVARQTVREARKIDVDIKYVRSQSEIVAGNKLYITNYEMLGQFDYSYFGAVVLDESSILKSIGGKTRQRLTELCKDIKYKLCCTATPAPNDYIELGNHTEFLGICKESEMLAMFFINANKEHTIVIEDKVYRKKGTNKGGTEWRLKHHAEHHFFQWLASWAITMTKPSDLGHDDDGFILPPLKIYPVFVHSDYKPENQLFFTHLHGITDRVKVRRSTLNGKLDELRKIICNEKLCYNTSYEQKGISQKMGGGESKTCQGISRENERTSKCEKAGTVCERREQKNRGESANSQMAKEKSTKEEGAEVNSIQYQPREICQFISPTEQSMCNLQNDNKQSEYISVGRSLPYNWGSSGVIVSELQPSDRENERFSTVTTKSSRVFRNQWIIWCQLDDEQRAIEQLLLNDGFSISSVYGGLSIDEKVKRIEDWEDGYSQILISKPKVCGFGMNFQNASNMVFLGLNDSWEGYYQCIRREWRYGQEKAVNVYLILHDVEMEIYQNIMRKDAMAKRLIANLIDQVKDYEKGELGLETKLVEDYKEETIKGEHWVAMLGDACERLKEIPDNSIDLSVYSPPFADLFTYTASERDLGNSKDWDEFFAHYRFIIKEMLRVTKTGRLTCVHTSDIPAMANRDGYIGLKDFPGEVIRAYEKEGWIFTGRAFIQKNPQAQAIRVKSKALLFVQLRKDSSDSRPALVDQVLIFKKDGENTVPITPVKNKELDNETWIEWANGIWLGISESDTLQFNRARGIDDEKHICPLQLGTIERCIKLYSNPNETVLTPFGGIGSEAYQAIRYGRRAILIELKPEYFEVAVNNLKQAEMDSMARDLFTQPISGGSE